MADNEWLLETSVCSYEGIGRFIMGLLHDIEIIEPVELKNFIREKIKSHEKK
jgi:predicted DNA-binding transcriptional regulator YafY